VAQVSAQSEKASFGQALLPDSNGFDFAMADLFPNCSCLLQIAG
jgi:hypothetical protein